METDDRNPLPRDGERASGPALLDRPSAPVEEPAIVAVGQHRVPLLPLLLELVLLLGVGVWLILTITGKLGGPATPASPTAPVGPLITRTEVVDQGIADAVDITIANRSGSLTLAGGASHLLEGTFTYNVAQWRPEVTYDGGGATGYLTVQQPPAGLPAGSTARYSWNLRLDSTVPTRLAITLGTGPGDLRLAGLALTWLEINTGAGETSVDLVGAWKHDLPIVVHGGPGPIRLILPSDSGVQVTTFGGPGAVIADGFHRIGSTYTNDCYNTGRANLRIAVALGAGNLTLDRAMYMLQQAR